MTTETLSDKKEYEPCRICGRFVIKWTRCLHIDGQANQNIDELAGKDLVTGDSKEVCE